MEKDTWNRIKESIEEFVVDMLNEGWNKAQISSAWDDVESDAIDLVGEIKVRDIDVLLKKMKTYRVKCEVDAKEMAKSF